MAVLSPLNLTAPVLVEDSCRAETRYVWRAANLPPAPGQLFNWSYTRVAQQRITCTKAYECRALGLASMAVNPGEGFVLTDRTFSRSYGEPLSGTLRETWEKSGVWSTVDAE